VFRFAHRIDHGARAGVACRAHADTRHPAADRGKAVYRGGISERLRQDQSCNADSARRAAGLALLQLQADGVQVVGDRRGIYVTAEGETRSRSQPSADRNRSVRPS
jgi:hypothetical protein